MKNRRLIGTIRALLSSTAKLRVSAEINVKADGTISIKINTDKESKKSNLADTWLREVS